MGGSMRRPPDMDHVHDRPGGSLTGSRALPLHPCRRGMRAGTDFSQPVVNSEPRTLLRMVGFWSAYVWSLQVEKLCGCRRNHPGERAPVHVGLKRFPTGLFSSFKAKALCSAWETPTLTCLLSPTTFLPQGGLN